MALGLIPKKPTCFGLLTMAFLLQVLTMVIRSFRVQVGLKVRMPVRGSRNSQAFQGFGLKVHIYMGCSFGAVKHIHE